MAIKEALDESKGIKRNFATISSHLHQTLHGIILKREFPPVLFNFLALIIGFTEEVDFVKFVDIPESNELKVLSFA